MKRSKLYKRLPGRFRSLLRQCSLWQGDDHFLSVERGFTREIYRRYHFSDIQALIIRPTATWHIGTVVATAFFLLFLFPGWFRWQKLDLEGALMGWFPAAVVLLILLIHLFRGRSCRCYLQMKVGQHELPSLRRLRAARKLQERLRTPIAEAQKEVKTTSQVTSTAPADARKPVAVMLKDYSGRWHLVFFGLLLLDLLVDVWRFYQAGLASFVFSALNAIALLAMAITALVAQRNTRLPASARTPVWIMVGTYIASNMFASIYVNVYLVMKNPRAFATQAQQLQAMINLQPLEHPVYATIMGVCMVISLICCVVGTVSTLRYRQRRAETAR